MPLLVHRLQFLAQPHGLEVVSEMLAALETDDVRVPGPDAVLPRCDWAADPFVRAAEQQIKQPPKHRAFP